jgi:hypothetical protein
LWKYGSRVAIFHISAKGAAGFEVAFPPSWISSQISFDTEPGCNGGKENNSPAKRIVKSSGNLLVVPNIAPKGPEVNARGRTSPNEDNNKKDRSSFRDGAGGFRT